MNDETVKARLALFRYGLVVIVVIAFSVALIVPFYVQSLAGATDLSGLVQFLPIALIAAAIVAVIMVAAYFGYAAIISRVPHIPVTPSSRDKN
ncbi:MAG: hypothetical protein ACOYL5_12625 [Phototrophicaceae bacterium]|jgi:cation transporter-like permease